MTTRISITNAYDAAKEEMATLDTAELEAIIRETEKELSALDKAIGVENERYQAHQREVTEKHRHEYTRIRNAETMADARKTCAERTLERNAVNAAITATERMSQEGIQAGIRAALKSKQAIVEDVVERIITKLHYCAMSGGLTTDELHSIVVWLDNEHYRTYKLSNAQHERVCMVLKRACPLHPETGNYLPTWTV